MEATILSVAATTTATLSLLGLVVYLLFPRCKEFVWTVISTDEARFDDLRIKSMSRTTAEQNMALHEALQPELQKLSEIERQIARHDDELQFVRAAVIEQGKEIKQLPLIARAIEATAEAQKDMAGTLKEIHEGMLDHSRRMERWEGYMDGQRDQWTGTERRRRPGGRRKGETT